MTAMRTELVDLLGESPCRQVALRRHWRVVEEQIGRELPEDYRWFVEEYGDALIAGSLLRPASGVALRLRRLRGPARVHRLAYR